MGQGNVGDGLDFCHLEYPQIRLPLMEPIERIIVGAQVLRQPAMPSNGAETSDIVRSEEHTSELQSRLHLVCRLLLEKKNASMCALCFNVERTAVPWHVYPRRLVAHFLVFHHRP